MINDKKMEMDQLDIVAGGTFTQSHEIASFLKKAGYRGMFKGLDVNYKNLRSVVDSLGFRCNDHGGFRNNTYVNKVTNKEYSQEEFKIALQIKFPNVRFA